MSSADAACVRALRAAGVDSDITLVEPLCGGCIDHVARLHLADGNSVVAKRGPATARSRFEEEMIGLGALAQTDTVLTPQPLGVHEHDGTVILLMTWLQPASATPRAWEHFGTELAALHSADAGCRYGFHTNNHLGSTPQINDRRDDWVEFNRDCRFGYQVKRARDRGLIDGDDWRVLNTFINRLGEFIPARPKPALLHGDLWSGNAIAVTGERIAVIDPAPSVGDGWADVAMMQLFGGFPAPCFNAYAEAIDDHDQVASRIQVYQIYHLLNHINIFGRGYLGQTMAAVRGLLRTA